VDLTNAIAREELSGNSQEGVGVILAEFQDTGLTFRKDPLDIRRGTIATTDPNDLGWESEKETSLMKIGILRDNDEVVIAGKFPDYGIIRVPQTLEAHVGRARVDRLQRSGQARR
jgi:hypothetical protein